jgi:hypothetical protein
MSAVTMPKTANKVDIELARNTVFAGIVDGPTLDEIFGFSERQRSRHIAAGMPHILWRGRKLFELEKVRQWILSHEVDRAPRARGRPRGRTTKTPTLALRKAGSATPADEPAVPHAARGDK